MNPKTWKEMVERTRELENINLKIVRICNLDIDENFCGVCEFIDLEGAFAHGECLYGKAFMDSVLPKLLDGKMHYYMDKDEVKEDVYNQFINELSELVKLRKMQVEKTKEEKDFDSKIKHEYEKWLADETHRKNKEHKRKSRKR